MKKSYVIEWKSTVNGRSGQGTKLFTLEEAEKLADELNREYPGIHHEVAQANRPAEPAAMPAETEPDELEPVAEVPEGKRSPDYVFSA